MHHKHKYTVEHREQEKNQSGISIQQVKKIQDHCCSAEHDQIIPDNPYHLMQWTSQEHIPVDIAKKIHSQIDHKAGAKKHPKVHPRIITFEKSLISYIISQNQTDKNTDTVHRQNHQCLYF